MRSAGCPAAAVPEAGFGVAAATGVVAGPCEEAAAGLAAAPFSEPAVEIVFATDCAAGGVAVAAAPVSERSPSASASDPTVAELAAAAWADGLSVEPVVAVVAMVLPPAAVGRAAVAEGCAAGMAAVAAGIAPVIAGPAGAWPDGAV